MKRKNPSTSLPEFTELTREDQHVNWWFLHDHCALDTVTCLDCVQRFKRTFQTKPPEPDKD